MRYASERMKRLKGAETETKGRYKGGATRTHCTQRREKQEEEPQAASEVGRRLDGRESTN